VVLAPQAERNAHGGPRSPIKWVFISEPWYYSIARQIASKARRYALSSKSSSGSDWEDSLTIKEAADGTTQFHWPWMPKSARPWRTARG
jgi:hypothetical protein